MEPIRYCYFCNKELAPGSLVSLINYEAPTPNGVVQLKYFVHVICGLHFLLDGIDQYQLTNEHNFEILELMIKTIEVLKNKNLSADTKVN